MASTLSPGASADQPTRGRRRKVDAADARGTAKDPAASGGGQRVLVIDVGERHLDDDVSGVEIVDGAGDELATRVTRVGEQEGAKSFH